MEVNLTDWLGDNSWAIWLSLAFLLGSPRSCRSTWF